MTTAGRGIPPRPHRLIGFVRIYYVRAMQKLPEMREKLPK